MNVTAIPDLIHDLVREVCEEENFQDYKIEMKENEDKNAGIMGEIGYLTISDKKKQLDLVVKTAFPSEIIRRNTPIQESFLNEINFYTKIWPKLNQFQSEKISNGFNNITKCYKCNNKLQSEIIILENLKKSGFEHVPKKATLNSDHFKYIFETYGKFHGISFALRQTQPEEFKKLTKGIVDVWKTFMDGPVMPPVIKGVAEKAGKALVPGEDDELIRKFEKYVKYSADILRDSTIYKGKNSVIIHGDCWSNNMMFKYNDGKLVDLRLIDWQLTNEGSPVYDLSYCLYSGASQDIIDNLDDYLEIYHKVFSKTVDELGGDSSEFTFGDLKSEWRDNATYGFMISLMVIKMKLTEDDKNVDFTVMDTGENFQESYVNSPCNEEEFQRRIRGLLRHLNEIDAL